MREGMRQSCVGLRERAWARFLIISFSVNSVIISVLPSGCTLGGDNRMGEIIRKIKSLTLYL